MYHYIRTISAILLLSGFSSLSYSADLEQGIYELNRGEFHAAITQLKPLSDEGFSPAQYQMGLIYQHGYGVPKSAEKAFELFEKSAQQNYPDAQFELALIYSEGKLVKKDLIKAFELTHKAAKKGLSNAQFNLAVMYANGEGVKQDNYHAARWYTLAANQNNALAQFNLALQYAEGKGVEKSTEKSYIWNIVSARNGYKDAEKSLLIDQRTLSELKIQQAQEEANKIYWKILDQQKLKAKMAAQKSTY